MTEEQESLLKEARLNSGRIHNEATDDLLWTERLALEYGRLLLEKQEAREFAVFVAGYETSSKPQAAEDEMAHLQIYFKQWKQSNPQK